jgi:AraC family transcriptional regulator of adaptative response / DNA-3-methyladenine glycosylase II
LFPRAEDLAEADIARIGLPKARAEAITALARSVIEKRLRFDSPQDPTDLQSRLKEIPGIGEWTAQYIAMRLGDPDAFPAGDLGVKHALSIAGESKITQRAEAWRPWRAYAVMYLWQSKPAIASRRKSSTEATTRSAAA